MALRLGIDLDGVVVNFTSGWIDRYNEQFGTSISRDRATTWDAPVELGTFDSMRSFWRWASQVEGGFWERMEPYPGALPTLRSLAEAGHRIVIITTKPYWADGQTLRWLADHDVPTREIHITDDKPMVACDVYLEDYDENLARLAAERPEAVVCRFIRPWNNPHSTLRDVESWDDFARVVEELASPS